MKVIVVGATGAVGHQVVLQCIETPQISSVVVLSRLPIDETLSKNPKVHVILNHNFLFYPPGILEQLKGSQCCIWCLAYKVQDFPELETIENVILDFPLAAADAINRKNISNGQKFHFVFCSGNSMEWDPERKHVMFFWDPEKKQLVFSATRELKGSAERSLQLLTDRNKKTFLMITLRPGGVLPDDHSYLKDMRQFRTPVVGVSELARALVRVCLDPPTKLYIQNEEIVRLGKA